MAEIEKEESWSLRRSWGELTPVSKFTIGVVFASTIIFMILFLVYDLYTEYWGPAVLTHGFIILFLPLLIWAANDKWFHFEGPL